MKYYGIQKLSTAIVSYKISNDTNSYISYQLQISPWPQKCPGWPKKAPNDSKIRSKLENRIDGNVEYMNF